MARQLSIPKENLPSIALMAKSHEVLPLIEQVAQSLDAEKRTPSAIVRGFASKAKLPVAAARRIVNQLLSFHALEDRLSMSAGELFESLTESLEGDPENSSAVDMVEWKAGAKNITNALSKETTLHIVEKNVRLAFDHPNPIHESKIITDIRPIFDESGRSIKQLTIIHSLQLEYQDGNRRRTLFLTLDAADVSKLKKSCERAETKAISIKKQMEAVSWPVMIWGEYPDE